MRYIDHHDLDPPGPNFQHIGGVLFGPTKGTNLNLLYFAQLSRKYDKSGYVWNAYVSSCWEEVINAYNCSKSSQTKSWSVVFVQVVGVYNKL